MEDDLDDEARLFCYAVGSRYFVDIVTALQTELSRTDPAQLEALGTLCERLRAMRDLIEQKLRDQHKRAALEAMEAQQAVNPYLQQGLQQGVVLREAPDGAGRDP